MLKHLQYNELKATVGETDIEVATALAAEFSAVVRRSLEQRPDTCVVMAPSPVDHPVMVALRGRSDIPWNRITVLIVDAYVGDADDAPQSTAFRLRHNFLDMVRPKEFIPMRGDRVPLEDEIEQYAALVVNLKPVVAVLGIGANGHLAFNEPPADFDSAHLVHVVDVSDSTRMEILRAGLYPTSDVIPVHALTLSIKGLLTAENIFAFAIEREKSGTIRRALEDEISSSCPASILQATPNARMFLGPEAAAQLGHQNRDPRSDPPILGRPEGN